MAKLVRLAPISYDRAREVRDWVTSLRLSRPIANIARDTATAWLPAEAIHSYFPRIVDLHNYSQGHSLQQREVNWDTLNVKVLKRLGFQLVKSELEGVIKGDPQAAEQVLSVIKYYTDTYFEAGLSPGKATDMAQGKHHNQTLQLMKELDTEALTLRKRLKQLQEQLEAMHRTNARKDYEISRLSKKLAAAGFK